MMLSMLALLLLAAPAPGQWPFPGSLPGTEIGTANLPPWFEPSGIVWHARLQQLLVVDDNGFLASMPSAGGPATITFVGGDLEAIAYANADWDRIYLGREHPDAILEFSLTSNSVVRTFDLTPFMTGPDNLGMEALTFVPIAGHPEGGEFYAGLQHTGVIYRFTLPIVSSATSANVTFLGAFVDGSPLPGISGMDFDRATGTLYSIYDGASVVRATRAAGTIGVGSWALPGNDQEGIAVDACCRLYIAEDAGVELWYYDGFPAARPASWVNHGVGYPGTLGVPSLTLADAPTLGVATNFIVTNSRGQPTLGAVVVGVGRTAIATPFGGTLLVDGAAIVTAWVLGRGATLQPFAVPNDPLLCGLVANLQIVEFDPGASASWSFSRGLELTIGR